MIHLQKFEAYNCDDDMIMEKLNLKIYLDKLKYLGGDALIGYGHKILPSENFSTITPEIAEELLIKDAIYASEGVKRLFKMWNSMGIDIKVTQNQFDVMVSLAYSMGVGAFRGSDFVQALKQQDFIKASRLLKYTGVSHPGHIKRRSVESSLFML
jgi:lysozyme